MKVLALIAINQHLDELIEDARRARLARDARRARGEEPSALRRALSALRSAVTRSSGSKPALAA